MDNPEYSFEFIDFLCQFSKVCEPQNLATHQFGLMDYMNVHVQTVNGSVCHADSEKWIHWADYGKVRLTV